MTGGTEGAGLAGECEEVFIVTVLTPDASKSISENAAIQVSEEDFLRNRPVVTKLVFIPVGIDIFQPLTMLFHQLIE